ncbi:MAG: hypothetical protein KU37_02985 [Sulfuricurvum sp. PC08-66]|nr:MAG: hypothetical protein KU37_02985 [Sulfuricurvum sp. PC08-66]
MKQLFFIAIAATLLLAKSYMGQIEPIQSYNLFAQASGEIVALDTDIEHTLYTGTLLNIDATLEKARLARYQEQLALYQSQYALRQAMYKKAKDIAGKSQTEKDVLELSMLDAAYKVSATKLQIEELKETLSHKTITVTNRYIKSFFVNLHDYVNVGTKVAQIYDISKAKIILYLHKSDMENLSAKTIWINDQESNATIAKIDTTTDAVYVSSHKVEIHLDSSAFGEVVKVEFR